MDVEAVKNLRVAYADPPYMGCSDMYKKHKDYGGEVDHYALINTLNGYDAWALSCHSPSLRVILPMCPEDVRIMVWAKTFSVFKPNVNPAYAWEPVIVRGGRKRGRGMQNMMDWIAAPPPMNQRRNKGLAGLKPESFCFWLFDAMNLMPNDEFHDLFPGSGAVSCAWEAWRSQGRLFDRRKAASTRGRGRRIFTELTLEGME